MLADELFEAAQNIRPYVDHPDSLYADAYDPVTQAKGLHVLRLLDELRGELDRPPTAEQAAMAARYRHTQERVEAAAAAARKSPAPLVRRGMRTPWGVATSATVLAPGVGYVVTPGHGGYKLDRRLNASVPPYMRQPGGWYEYDCD